MQDEVCDWASFTLLDFNDETLEHARKLLEDLKSRYHRNTKIEMIKKSVHQVLKETAKPGEPAEHYDLVYCAGVFDYLSDRICKRLMNIFYDMLEPGGLLFATNVDASNPSRNGMEYLLEWHLIYRNAMQLGGLTPDRAPPEGAHVRSDETGVNIYIEVRKPREVYRG
jgi:extracellular factor (EF) 3-hydroxypalmitic acid methyl ester biosynthesis protein